MRLRLKLEHRPNQILPINYQYLISSWIYRTLGNANATYARQLHEKGYDFAGKQYKLFTFSQLRPKLYELNKQQRTITLVESPTFLELSFFVDEAIQHFVMGLFRDQQFILQSGRFQAKFFISIVESKSKPFFQNTMRFRSITPLCISQQKKGEKYAQYISPEVEGYGDLLAQNLLRKQQAFQLTMFLERAKEEIKEDFFSFQLLSTPRSKLISIKGTQLRGYLFDFELTAPIELMRLGYYGGFGEKNSSVGMGMVGII